MCARKKKTTAEATAATAAATTTTATATAAGGKYEWKAKAGWCCQGDSYPGYSDGVLV